MNGLGSGSFHWFLLPGWGNSHLRDTMRCLGQALLCAILFYYTCISISCVTTHKDGPRSWELGGSPRFCSRKQAVRVQFVFCILCVQQILAFFCFDCVEIERSSKIFAVEGISVLTSDCCPVLSLLRKCMHFRVCVLHHTIYTIQRNYKASNLCSSIHLSQTRNRGFQIGNRGTTRNYR